ncbi:NAD-dependent epimerase/dehydratase family protein [Paenibacillus glucanolyticus]|uniref:NAD-dependent epimerase/dehydratase family protein n=1 Tax=Paenibacillus glucanolyticus TaxID=59843 RepID=UPI0013E325A9|nr:NAD-dependent epimerase/dehydratase family protein [Paenibacillus glucanolyticus]
MRKQGKHLINSGGLNLLRRTRCLIFGGNGFIGYNLTKSLALSNDFEISVFAKEIGDIKNVRYIIGDFRNDSDLENSLENIDTVIHLISSTSPAESQLDYLEAYQVDLIQTLKLIEISRKKGINRIVYSSSGGTVYGQSRYIPIDEEHKTEPINNYGVIKLTIEKVLIMYNKLHNMDNVILRISNPYGLKQREDKSVGAVTILMNKIKRGEPITIYGSGDTVRDYVYIDDVIDAFIRTIGYTGKEEVFNIGTGQGTSLIELVSSIENKLGKKAIIEYKDARRIDVQQNVLSIEKAKAELKYQPRYQLDKGLDVYIKIHK